MKRKIMGCSVLRNDQTCLVGAAGEALEAELNKTGPGSCKFVKSDISKEEDIKVKCSFVGVWSEMERVTWSHDDHMMISLNSVTPAFTADVYLSFVGSSCLCRGWLQSQWSSLVTSTAWSTTQAGVSLLCVCCCFLLTRRHDNKAVLLTVCFCVWNLPLQTLLINPLTTPQQRSSETCWIWTSSATFWRLKYVFTALGANNFCLRW